MKLLALLPLVAVTSAFVIPDDEVMDQIAFEAKKETKSIFDKIPSIFSSVEETFKSGVATAENALDVALDGVFSAVEKTKSRYECYKSMVAYDVDSWLLESSVEPFEDTDEKPDHPHRRPPHHRRPHHPHKPNQTVYELINKSKYTTKFAKLINEYDDLVETLNGTTNNFTLFVPIDKAFEKIPKGHKPDKELIKNILAYHFSPHFYPAGRVLTSHTIGTAYREAKLGDEPQRLRLGLSLRGLTVNFYARIIRANFFGTNGVIHAVDHILLPPPGIVKIIELLPGEFSTTQLALYKAFDEEEDWSHAGATFFAPSNWAWKKLGPVANAFLFSDRGTKYLKALLQYHIVLNSTLYSDAFYGPKKDDVDAEAGHGRFPKGVFHVELQTLLKDHKLSIDVGRYGGLINIRINGYNDVAVQDGIAQDGVIQVPRSVIIPPKHPRGHGVEFTAEDEMLTEEDLIERLGPYVEEEKEEVREQKAWFDL